MKTWAQDRMLALLVGLALSVSGQAALTHRYSFNGNANDSIGAAHGTLLGNAMIVGNVVVFDGSPDTYVNLPGGLIAGLTSLTIEFWAELGVNGNWSRIYDFGDVDGAVGRNYVMFTPHSGAGDFRMSYSDADPGYNHELIVGGSGVLDDVGPIHVACVYDPPTGFMGLYTNGTLITARNDLTFPLSSVSNTLCWLGRSLYSADAWLNGAIDEFRIYDTGLNSVEIAASFASGPDIPSIDPGELLAVALQIEPLMIAGNTQPSLVIADYAKVKSVSLTGVPGVTYQSSDTNVITVSTAGQIKAIGVGTASLMVSYQGKSSTKPITVNRREGLVIAGTLYVDLRAADASAGSPEWVNRGVLGPFTEVGDPMLEPNVGGTGQAGVQFNGASDAYTGPATAPDLEGNSDRSIEVWAYNPQISDEETLVAMGHRGTTRRNMSFNYGSNSSYGSVGQWADDLGWSGPAPAAGAWHQLVYTYNGANVARVYADGVLKTRKTLGGPLNTFAGEPIKLAVQGDTTGQGLDFGTRTYSGYIAVVRIHGGLLSDADVFNNYLFGIELTSPGTFQSISLQVDAKLVLAGFGQAMVYAQYSNRTNVDLSGQPGITFQSSDTNIVTVSTNGLMRAVGRGSAVITATYQGRQDNKTVEVVESLPITMRHRYGFNEAAGGTTVADTVGGANGTLEGAAALTGDGKVTLDGSSGYVDLPNGIISSLTNATFETWVTWNGPSSSVWQRIFDFGSSTGGEDMQGSGVTYLFMTPRAGGAGLRFAATLTGGGAGEQMLNYASPLPTGRETHLVVTYGYSLRTAKLYLNGRLVATNRVTIALKDIYDNNNWLGRSQFSADAYLNGQLNEFRIYEGILSGLDVAISAAAGPNTIMSSGPGTLQSVELSLETPNLFLGGMVAQASLLGNFQNISRVNISSFAGVRFESSNPNVAAISTNGLVEAVGVGTTTLNASYQDKQASLVVTVARAPGAPEKVQLLHRYSFSEAPGSATVKDSVGTADGTVEGTATFTGDGKLSLPGGAVGSGAGYVDLPNGIISSLTNATFEAWITWTAASTWQRIFDFGSNTSGENEQGTGDTYLFLTPRGVGSTGPVRFAITVNSGGGETPILDRPSALPTGVELHVAVTYDFLAGSARLFVNGQRVAIGAATIPLSSINDINNWLGRSNWPDPFFAGQFNEFRIYDGALLDAEVAASFAAGPETLPSDEAMRRLEIRRSGSDVIIAWPVGATGLVLESATSLGPGAVWNPVGIVSVVESGMNKVTVAASQATMFFRLKKQVPGML
jgi:hypothetical protein